MSKLDQVLNLDPSIELRFKGPFTDVVTSELTLSNPTDKRVCFKVKTTAPKKYCVRPNSGIIEPGTFVKVAVMLQPFDYDPHEKNKHKFMVQTMFAPSGPIDSVENLWKEASAESLMDSKLRCVFEMPPDAAQNNLDSSVEDPSTKVNAPKVSSATPEKQPLKGGNSDPELRKALDDCRRLQADVNNLRQENASLKDSETRLRKVAMSETVSSARPAHDMAQAQAQANQIPPVVLLIAALLLGLFIGKFIL
ncbi:vesicle-associated membrane protein/synaptobrevin-binding protein-like isoform X1 [Lineus longissimus]|uniref:vesicle-associated membrane protein/synaptobrevin-binding protein-like isoform X1 n=1 Tax=Lineus longissimus TaxID=88925 RepID=UPI002B4E4148